MATLSRLENKFDFWTKECPGKTALVCDGTELTFSEIERQVADLVQRFRLSGCKDGRVAALLAGNSLQFVVAYLALLKCGQAVLPLNPALSERELKQHLTRVKVDALLYAADAGHLDKLCTDTCVKWTMDINSLDAPRRREATSGSLARPGVEVPADCCVLLYSSGSTGDVKYVPRSIDNLHHDAWHLSAALDLTCDEVLLAVTPFFHAYGLLNILIWLHLGATLVIVRRPFPHWILDHAKNYEASVLLSTPFVLDALTQCFNDQRSANPLRGLRHCISSTGPLGQVTYDNFWDRYEIPVRGVYGCTEAGTVTISTNSHFSDANVGRPMQGIDIKIFDEDNHELPDGRIGRVGIKSPSVSHSYLQNPELTRKVYRDGFLFPGDLGHIDEQGELFIAGRTDIINVGGLKVDPAEVERVLLAFPSIKDVEVYSGNLGDTEIVKAVVATASKAFSVEELLADCRSKLAPYKIPKSVIVVPEIPRDDNGKVSKARLMSLTKQVS